MKSIRLCGVRIDDLTLSESVSLALLPRQTPCVAVTPNAVMLDACRKDPRYAALLNRSTLSLPDGIGVLRAAQRMGTPLRKRVAGIDFGAAVLREASRQGLRVFLLGGEPGVAKKAAKNLRVGYPGLKICGTCHGYFQKTGAENRRVVNAVLSARADILFVCFGFPLQEEWIMANLPALKELRLIAGLGGSLDVWSGRIQRAPRFFIDHGLEWAWRMAREPARLKNLPALLIFSLSREKSHEKHQNRFANRTKINSWDAQIR